MVTSSDDQNYKPKTASTSHQNQPSSATTNNNVTDSFVDPYTPPSSNSSDDESASSPKSFYTTANSTTVNNNNNHHDFLLPAYKLNSSNHQGENKSTNTKRPSVDRTRSSSEPIPYSASYEPSLLVDVKPNKIVHAKPQNAEEFCKKFLDNDDGDDSNQQDSSLSDIINIIKEEKDPNIGLTLPPTPTTATFTTNNRDYNSNSTVQQLTPFTETLPPLPPLFEENFRNFGSDEIDRLCSELKTKAKCSANGGLRVLAEDELEAVLVKLEKNN
ncbi:6221_t:CDS:2 [Entrophospora sp. SA101]|nr:15730_t:CDS:2 [Entrophospora sp. SA101]CAJ0635789.1 6221_t:CDS:2 [Entrophospora sp. SA101]CAJ0834700.1 4483_t:CDS:2 [Entrophospora sp. SA101]CAJ0926570.1 12963_t:CDS:2 [Entrophospora sp. SA101]